MAIKLTFNSEPNSEAKPFPKLMWNKKYGCLFYMVSPSKGVPLDGGNWDYNNPDFFTSWDPIRFEDYNSSVIIQNK